ncbi:hypothetical protein ACFL96_04335 [Thermoproteota archaeon]
MNNKKTIAVGGRGQDTRRTGNLFGGPPFDDQGQDNGGLRNFFKSKRWKGKGKVEDKGKKHSLDLNQDISKFKSEVMANYREMTRGGAVPDVRRRRGQLCEEAKRLGLSFADEWQTIIRDFPILNITSFYQSIGGRVERRENGLTIHFQSDEIVIVPEEYQQRSRQIEAIRNTIIGINRFFRECFDADDVYLEQTGIESFRIRVRDNERRVVNYYSVLHFLIQNAIIHILDRDLEGMLNFQPPDGFSDCLFQGQEHLERLRAVCARQVNTRTVLQSSFEALDPSIRATVGYRAANGIEVLGNTAPNQDVISLGDILLETSEENFSVALDLWFEEFLLADSDGNRISMLSEGARYYTVLSHNSIDNLISFMLKVVYIISLYNDPNISLSWFLQDDGNPRLMVGSEDRSSFFQMLYATSLTERYRIAVLERIGSYYDNIAFLADEQRSFRLLDDVERFSQVRDAALERLLIILRHNYTLDRESLAPPVGLPDNYLNDLYRECDGSQDFEFNQTRSSQDEMQTRLNFLFQRLQNSPYLNYLSREVHNSYQNTLRLLRDDMNVRMRYYNPGNSEMVYLVVSNLDIITYILCIQEPSERVIQRFCEQFPGFGELDGCAEGLAGKLQIILSRLRFGDNIRGRLLEFREGLVIQFAQVQGLAGRQNSHSIPELMWRLAEPLGLGYKSEPRSRWLEAERFGEAVQYVFEHYSAFDIFRLNYEHYQQEFTRARQEEENPTELLQELGIENLELFINPFTEDFYWLKLEEDLPFIVLDYLIAQRYIQRRGPD